MHGNDTAREKQTGVNREAYAKEGICPKKTKGFGPVEINGYLRKPLNRFDAERTFDMYYGLSSVTLMTVPTNGTLATSCIQAGKNLKAVVMIIMRATKIRQRKI